MSSSVALGYGVAATYSISERQWFAFAEDAARQPATVAQFAADRFRSAAEEPMVRRLCAGAE
jgi:hypothetical protein